MLTDLLPLVPQQGFDSLRYILLGGGPIAKSVLEKCQQNQLSVIQSYGMTETCSQVVALPPEKASEKSAPLGFPFKVSIYELRLMGKWQTTRLLKIPSRSEKSNCKDLRSRLVTERSQSTAVGPRGLVCHRRSRLS